MSKKIVRQLSCAVSVSLLLTVLASCGQPAHSSVQLCLEGRADIQLLEKKLKALASELDLDFSNLSSLTETRNSSIERSISEMELPLDSGITQPVIHFVLRGADDIGVSVFNSGLPHNQVVVAFYTGHKPTIDQSRRLRQIEDNVLLDLAQKWSPRPIPKGEGAHPIAECQLPSKEV